MSLPPGEPATQHCNNINKSTSVVNSFEKFGGMPKHTASAGARCTAKKTEGSDLFSAILSGVGKIQEQVYLVSKDGEKLVFHPRGGA
jgi:hypothetical protein